jgi:hypothetical protein
MEPELLVTIKIFEVGDHLTEKQQRREPRAVF